MDILHTFEVYQKQLDNLRKNNNYSRPQILRQFRLQFKGFGANDISVLKTFLVDNDKKWFVAHLLDNLDTFPSDLLRPMLLAAVNEPDPSFNNNFIKPCRRVFDYVDIQKVLLDIFRNGNTSRKVGVLKALYWARPTVHYLTVQSGDHIVEQKGYDDFVWDEEAKEYIYDFNFVEDNSVFEKEYPRQIAAYTEQLSAILSEFYNTRDIELKYQIARRLPNELNQYPEELQSITKAFLHDKEKQFIPKNIAELEIVKNTDNYFWRKVLLKTRRFFIKEKGITLKQR